MENKVLTIFEIKVLSKEKQALNLGGLFNELKDLRILQIPGMTFGAVMPARELFRQAYREARLRAGGITGSGPRA